MAVGITATAREMGRRYAEWLRAEHVVRGLWISTRRECVEFWLLTEPIDAEAERHLYAIGAQLYEAFPEAMVRIHLLNPRLFEPGDLTDLLPVGAKSIPLRPGAQ